MISKTLVIFSSSRTLEHLGGFSIVMVEEQALARVEGQFVFY